MPAFLDDIHPGMQFGVLEVLSSVFDEWNCRCICGREGLYFRRELKYKGRRMCTCGRRYKLPKPKAEYTSWAGMIERCYRTDHKKYKDYGGRGIVVCDRWRLSFPAFLDDMGMKPSKRYTIGREDNDGHYEPSNCRWETPKQQSRNKRDNRIVEYRGQRIVLVDLAELVGIKYETLRARLDAGRTVEEAVTTAVQPWGR